MTYYLLIQNDVLVNMYQSTDPNLSNLLLAYGTEIEVVNELPPGIRVGYRRVDGEWVEGDSGLPKWQHFMNWLDVPERGGNGGYQLALSGPARVDAQQAYILVLLFIHNIAGDRELLTLWYHLNNIMELEPDTEPLLMAAVAAANIPIPPSIPPSEPLPLEAEG